MMLGLWRIQSTPSLPLLSGPLFSVEMSPLWSKHMYSVLSALISRPMPPAARYKLCSSDSAWAGEFARSAISAYSASVIVCAWYHQILFFANLFVISPNTTSSSSASFLSSGFGLFCLAKYGNTSYNAFYVQNTKNGSLISGLHCIKKTVNVLFRQ